jgi:hypothetical protein
MEIGAARPGTTDPHEYLSGSRFRLRDIAKLSLLPEREQLERAHGFLLAVSVRSRS